jgi:hypothetical protein
MKTSRKLLYLRDTEYTASKIIQTGSSYVEDAIACLGRVIDRSNCPETIKACEKLIEILNEGPEIRTINQLSEEQSRFAASMLSAVYDCITLTV